jgi:hypothetical protein
MHAEIEARLGYCSDRAMLRTLLRERLGRGSRCGSHQHLLLHSRTPVRKPTIVLYEIIDRLSRQVGRAISQSAKAKQNADYANYQQDG